MARKRGGLAGIWDRNKKIIKPVATGLAGLLGTPALGAAVGAAMGGLDRPGQSGVGLDVGGALKGGISGYGAGKAGDAIGAALPGIMALGKGGQSSGLTQRADGTWVNAFGQPRPAPSTNGLPELTPFGQVPIGASGGGAPDQMDFVPDQGIDFGNALGGSGMLGALGKAAGKAAGKIGLPSLGALGKGVGNALTGNSGMNALAFAQLLNAAQLGKKSGALANEALNTQRDLFAQKAPLRSAGVAGMQAPRAELPQLAKLGAISNPFATGGR